MSITDEYYNIAPEKIQFVLIPNVSRPVSEGEDMLCDFLKYVCLGLENYTQERYLSALESICEVRKIRRNNMLHCPENVIPAQGFFEIIFKHPSRYKPLLRITK